MWHLYELRNQCTIQSKVFWDHYNRLSKYESLISIPTIVVSSLAGLSSLSNLTLDKNSESATALLTLTSILTVLSTILTSINKYLQYGERAVKAKNQAKGLSEISRSIQLNTILISNDVEIGRNTIMRMAEDVYKNLDILGRDLDEVPKNISEILLLISEQAEQAEQVENEVPLSDQSSNTKRTSVVPPN